MKKFVVKPANNLKSAEVVADSFDAIGGFFIFKDGDKSVAAFKADDIQSITSSEMILTLGGTHTHTFDPNKLTTQEGSLWYSGNKLNIS